MTSVVNTETGEIESSVLNYEVHPVAALFPFIEGEAFREFVEDIRVNGQREPVVLDAEGRLLDGRNRARACQALGIDVKETRYSGDDVEQWIISHNVHRRHLTTSQKAMIAARLATLKHGSNQYAEKVDGSKEPSTPEAKSERSAPSIVEAAAQFNIARESVKRARAVIESGDDDLIKAVESGEKTVSAAAREVRSSAPAAADDKRAWVRAEERVKQISDLAERGATSAQIAREIGVSEIQVRRLAREHGVLIIADEVRGKVRRLNYDVILANAAESVEVASMAVRDIDPGQLDKEEALERLDSLTTSINALSKAVKKIKESLHE
ncbi:MAG TPA: hypothetical protein VGE38_08285 [Nocardioides sp.]|uniref:hypothetical protein n=1 Tax=Nocardioides sp. TaxID=35761 RepID=UPI002ED819E5